MRIQSECCLCFISNISGNVDTLYYKSRIQSQQTVKAMEKVVDAFKKNSHFIFPNFRNPIFFSQFFFFDLSSHVFMYIQVNSCDVIAKLTYSIGCDWIFLLRRRRRLHFKSLSMYVIFFYDLMETIVF